MIQPERNLFPVLFPNPPEKEEDLLNWAKEMSNVYSQFTRQAIDHYNRHINQTHGHPKSWPVWKLPRPSFRAHPTQTDKVVLPASVSSPKYFSIGGQIFELTQDQTLDMDASGVDGLDTGSKATNTLYYLYGINNQGSFALITSVNPPTTGPVGYTDWTYLGSFRTHASGAVVGFHYLNGRFQGEVPDVVSHTGNTNYTSKGLLIPDTAKFVTGMIGIVATATGWVDIAPTATPGSTGHYHEIGATSGNWFAWACVPIVTPHTIYIKTSNSANTGYLQASGWIEDPTEWK